MSVFFERRQRPRLTLRGTLRILGTAGRLDVEGRVVNISSQGVFWISSELFPAGERVQGYLLIGHSGFGPDSEIRLWCSLRVVRTEEVAGGFGMGCRFDEYSLAPKAQAGSWAPGHVNGSGAH